MQQATGLSAQSGAFPEAPKRLRAAQTESFIAEDFDRYFAVSEQLAAICPAFGRSYEYWTHTVLHALARYAPGLAFLQVGAMDGKRFDPIYAFVKHYRWSGVVMEPLPDLFDRLAANYAGHPQVSLVNAALADADGEREMMRVRGDAVEAGAVPLWAEGLGSFHPERNALGGVGLDADQHAALIAHAERQAVACLTLRSLAGRYGLQRIDMLQVDAEGCELDILRQVDSAGYRPRVIHLEHWALPAGERGALFALLGARGYRLRMSESDVMAIAPELAAAIDTEAGWAL